MQPTDRHHDLDAARSVLMMLGVVLHAANVYATPNTWLVGDPSGLRAFALLSDAIHVFRIPTFFVVAGFFSGFSLARYGGREFLRRRAVRLVVPLTSAGLVLGTLQSYVLYRYGAPGYGPPGGGEAGPLDYLGSADFGSSLREGLWVTHLWFLVNLIAYVLVTWLVAVLPFSGLLRNGVDALERTLGPKSVCVRRGLFLLALPLTGVLVEACSKYLPGAFDQVLGLTSLADLLAYAPYYLFGLAAYRARSLFEGVRRPGVWVLPALVLASLLWQSLDQEPRGLAQNIGYTYVRDLVVWLSIAVCLGFFRRVASRPSPTFGYLSEAAYTVYLFHHLAVIALGWALAVHAPQLLGATPRFVAVVGVTLVGTLALHHYLVLRHPVLRFAFNGKWR